MKENFKIGAIIIGAATIATAGVMLLLKGGKNNDNLDDFDIDECECGGDCSGCEFTQTEEE